MGEFPKGVNFEISHAILVLLIVDELYKWDDMPIISELFLTIFQSG